MPNKTYGSYRTGSSNRKQLNEERIVPHTPEDKKPQWAYTLKEGGQKYRVELPNTEAQIDKVKRALKNPRNWRKYIVSPYGGDRNYTQVTCFPPFEPIRVAEVYLPDGTVWSSRTKKFYKPDNNKQ